MDVTRIQRLCGIIEKITAGCDTKVIPGCFSCYLCGNDLKSLTVNGEKITVIKDTLLFYDNAVKKEFCERLVLPRKVL